MAVSYTWSHLMLTTNLEELVDEKTEAPETSSPSPRWHMLQAEPEPRTVGAQEGVLPLNLSLPGLSLTSRPESPVLGTESLARETLPRKIPGSVIHERGKRKRTMCCQRAALQRFLLRFGNWTLSEPGVSTQPARVTMPQERRET